uniref:TRAF-type domain-containing protein n=1 Tax=Chromera velia CCMP2878 TaxID=1169474 RepID=A0A0G4IEP7_9ALVE|eukprot:Cvel_13698.t1-p1 / transcript=Cvel_13698.t1 / gene=Cvel_13698 / organism=Chromera_velia_CCMP2878 / gene_product=hypothetical protein / transcript_product=hypothetical protein / location=Cvel_scaffold946:48557-49490(+) / protein_length=192 / sequence_SO=supercontig / SO=protein_coding / is_pseudo=false
MQEDGCPETPVPCRVPGCNVAPKRKNLECHLNDPEHRSKHQCLEKKEIDKLEMESANQESLTRTFLIPDFEAKLATMAVNDPIHSGEFSFQDGKYHVTLYPKIEEEGWTGFYLFKDAGSQKGITLVAGVLQVETRECTFWDYSNLIPGQGWGWSGLCETAELVSAARDGGGTLEIRFRISAPSIPLLPDKSD